MRGSDIRTGDLFSYVDLEQRVPANHPLRLIRRIVNEVLAALHSEFGRLYATEGRPSIAPERLLRALLLQAFYSIRSERQLMEQLHYNLLYRWFIGLGVDDQVWVPTVFTKNRDRLLEAEVARKFLAELLAHRDVRALLSDDHFSVDGTQVQAWASMKSFVANDGSSEPQSPGRNGERHFHREQRSNQTHGSITDPEAKLAKKGKGKEAKLAYTGNVMTENRNGFVVEAELRQVSGAVERETAKDMIVRYSPGAPSASPWAPTRASIRLTLYPTCGTSTLHRTWRKTRPIDSPPSTVARSATADTRSASRNANGSRSHSGGARPSADWRGQCCVA